MSITNYSELQTSVTNWLSRTNDTNLIALFPDCITLAESKFNRVLRTRDMETSASLVPASGIVTIPADFLEMRRIYIDTDTPIELEYLPPEQFYVKYPILINSSIRPSRYYTIEGASIILSDKVTSNNVKILYYAKIPALTISNTTNWLLTGHPDIYLYATLLEAYDIIKNEQQSQKFNAKTIANIEQLKNSDMHGKFSGSAKRIIAA